MASILSNPSGKPENTGAAAIFVVFGRKIPSTPVFFEYSNLDRIISVRVQSGAQLSTLASGITYSSEGALESFSFGNGIEHRYQYDDLGRLKGIIDDSILNLSVDYNEQGQAKDITDTINSINTVNYAYNILGRLEGATSSWGTYSWTFDNGGNVLLKNIGGKVTTYGYLPGTNQLISSAGEDVGSYSRDSNGNRVSDSRFEYVYDERNRLTSVLENSLQVASYVYGDDNLRVKKSVGGVETIFHYDLQGRLIAESEVNGTAKKSYIYLNGMILATVDENNNIFYYHNGFRLQPIKITDSSGDVAWHGIREPFGNLVIETGTVSNYIGFPGQYLDIETGLYYNGQRYYDPSIGRYITPDPIAPYGNTTNLFNYADGNPVMFIDPTGLTMEDIYQALIYFNRRYGDDYKYPNWQQYMVVNFAKLPPDHHAYDRKEKRRGYTHILNPTWGEGVTDYAPLYMMISWSRYAKPDIKAPGLFDLLWTVSHELVHWTVPWPIPSLTENVADDWGYALAKPIAKPFICMRLSDTRAPDWFQYDPTDADYQQSPK